MTVEERLQQMIGVQAFQIAALSTQLEQAQAELAKFKTELEKSKNPEGEE